MNPAEEVIRIELRCGDNLLSPARGWELVDTLRRHGLRVKLIGGMPLPSKSLWPSFWLEGDHFFEGDRPAPWSLTLRWSCERSDPDASVFLHLVQLYFQQGLEITRVEALFRDLVRAVDPFWGAALHPTSQPKEARLDLLQWGLPGIFWQNYLSDALVDWIGRERIAGVPYGEGRLIPRRGARISCGFEPDPRVEAQVRDYIGERFFSPESFPTRTVSPPLFLKPWAFLATPYLPGKRRLAPPEKRSASGSALVEESFTLSTDGESRSFVSCQIESGSLATGMAVQVQRAGRVVYRGSIASLRRFRQEVSCVFVGTFCGLALDDFNRLQPFDRILADED
jgi:hypothetical protein